MEREVDAASGSQKELAAFLDQTNNSRLRNEVCALPITCIAVRRELDDLFQRAVPLGNTVPRDELKDLVPDAELSLPAFNVVTGSYDPRSLKSTLLEFKTMQYGVKYTAVPRATAVDRFERSLLGDIQRGLAARDAAWHNTERGQKGPLRDILDMSEYTGMVFGIVALPYFASPGPAPLDLNTFSDSMASFSLTSAARPTCGPVRAAAGPLRLRAAAPAPSPCARLAVAPASRGAALVARAAEGEDAPAPAGPVAYKPTKYADVKDLSLEEIDAEVEKCKMELFYLRTRMVTRQEVKTSNIRVLRKKVAQLLTAKRQNFADMNKREFRSMERMALLKAGELVQ
eukprot:jgi/Tetstr1/458547/TSEL_044950.t1